MGLLGTRLLDNDGNPYSLTNPLPIQATITTSNLKIVTVTASNQSILSVGAAITNELPVDVATFTADKLAVQTITASNQSILSVGAAVTNPLLVSKDNNANASDNAIFVQVSTNTAQAHSNTVNIATSTADKLTINSITASNQSILSIGAAISNRLPVSVDTMTASNLTIASVGAAITNNLPVDVSTYTADATILVQVTTNTAQAHSNTVNIATTTADGIFRVSPTGATNTATNPFYMAITTSTAQALSNTVNIATTTADAPFLVSATDATNTVGNPIYIRTELDNKDYDVAAGADSQSVIGIVIPATGGATNWAGTVTSQIETITASNQSILSIGAAITNRLPVSVDTITALNHVTIASVGATITNPLIVNIATNTAQTAGVINISTITASNLTIASIGAAVSNPLIVHVTTNTAQAHSNTVNLATISASNQSILSIGAAISNQLPINVATQTTTNPITVNIATNTAQTAGVMNVSTITASNLSILSIGAAITNRLPTSLDTITASNLTIASIGAAVTNNLPVNVATITANSIGVHIITTTADAVTQISATQVTNTAANPIYTSNAGGKGTAVTIGAFNVTSTAWVTISALTNRISSTFQSMDGSITVYIAHTNTSTPTYTSNVLRLLPNATFEEKDYSSHWHLRTATATTARVSVLQVAA